MAVLKTNETNKIKELYRVIGEIPKTEKERNAKESQKVGEEWKAMGEICDVDIANQTDQLGALGFKMESKIPI